MSEWYPAAVPGSQRGARAASRAVAELFDRPVPVGQPGGVREQVPYQHLLLARRAELRPVPEDRRVRVEFASVGEDQGAQRRHRLGHRPDVDDRVALPWASAVGVREPAPDVHHGFAVHEDRDGTAHVPRVQQVGQRVRHGDEQVVVGALDVGHVPYPARATPPRSTGFRPADQTRDRYSPNSTSRASAREPVTRTRHRRARTTAPSSRIRLAPIAPAPVTSQEPLEYPSVAPLDAGPAARQSSPTYSRVSPEEQP